MKAFYENHWSCPAGLCGAGSINLTLIYGNTTEITDYISH